MKKTPINKVYSFHSLSSPHSFLERFGEEAVKSNLKFDQDKNGFDLQIHNNHGGKTVYRAHVSADDNGGSFISGEIITIPWNDKPNKKKSIIQKIFSIVGYIVVIPFMLIFLLCYGIYMLFVRLFHGKNIEVTNEEKLCDFMTNKMCCRQKEE